MIGDFLKNTLRLELHPKKLSVGKLSRGIDFVGYVLPQNLDWIRS